MTKTENTTTNTRAVLDVVGVRTGRGLRPRAAAERSGYRFARRLGMPAAAR